PRGPGVAAGAAGRLGPQVRAAAADLSGQLGWPGAPTQATADPQADPADRTPQPRPAPAEPPSAPAESPSTPVAAP
ncbi:serine/threonine protein kinase, partial [Plantactinospora veratri]